MTDIILLQTRFGFYDAMGVRVPTAMLRIAAVPVEKGYEVVLIDQRVEQDWREKLEEHLRTARIVGLTAIAGEQIKYMMEASKLVKALNKDVLIFLGGTWAQTEPEMCLEDPHVDFVCYGEGDYLLPEMMEYLDGKRRIENLGGVAYRNKEGKIRKNPPRQPIKNLDDLPEIPFDLVDLKRYSAIGIRPNMPSIALTVSRGCGFRCTFCNIPSLYGKQWRAHSVGYVISLLNELDTRYGIRDFFFMDDNLAGDYTWFSEFVRRMAEEVGSGKDYCWSSAGIRANTILRLTDEDMDNLMKSGCKNLDIGVESGNTRILKLIQKDITQDILRKANKRMSRYPILIKYTFMAGFPTETVEEFKDTLKLRHELLEENKHALGPIFQYTPFPGTPLFKLAIEGGLQVPDTLLGWADFNLNFGWYKKHHTWLTKEMISLIESTVFLSYFDTENLSYKYTNPLMNAIFRLYHPVAKFRGRHNFYALMLEKWVANLVITLNDRFRFFYRAQGKKS